MKREEIMNLDIEQLEVRAKEITEEIKNAETVDELNALEAELEALEERRQILNSEIEKRKKDIDAVVRGAGNIIDKEGEEEKMPNLEIRRSAEYMDAWVEFQKGRATEEQRALLTQNATEGGSIAVPVYVEEQIHTAWESNEIIRRVRRTYYRGNLKVGYEASADPAVLHNEGAEAITEEDLVVSYVELIPHMIKKLVRVSDEVVDMRGQAFLDYVFDEMEYQIVRYVANEIVTAMAGATAPLAQSVEIAGAAIATTDIINAEALLGGEATNPVFVTTRATAAALKAAVLSAGYGYDPFDGMEVVYTESTALGTALGIVADLSAVQLNLPNGDSVQFKFDDTTEADEDMIRIIGRLYAAVGVIAPGKIVKITPSTDDDGE